jgi:hypothetical protein
MLFYCNANFFLGTFFHFWFFFLKITFNFYKLFYTIQGGKVNSSRGGGALSQPHFGAKCEDEIHTPKVGDLESSGTPECLGFDSRSRNTSDLGVLGVIRKGLEV